MMTLANLKYITLNNFLPAIRERTPLSNEKPFSELYGGGQTSRNNGNQMSQLDSMANLK